MQPELHHVRWAEVAIQKVAALLPEVLHEPVKAAGGVPLSWSRPVDLHSRGALQEPEGAQHARVGVQQGMVVRRGDRAWLGSKALDALSGGAVAHAASEALAHLAHLEHGLPGCRGRTEPGAKAHDGGGPLALALDGEREEDFARMVGGEPVELHLDATSPVGV